MKEQKGNHRVGTIVFLFVFFLIAFWLVILPSIKTSGYVPSINRKIKEVFERSDFLKIEISDIYFWDYEKPYRKIPFQIDNTVINAIENIMKQEVRKDGFVNRKEPEIVVFSFYKNNIFFLKCECQWDKVQKIMEVRFTDDKGFMKNSYYLISDELALALFNFVQLK